MSSQLEKYAAGIKFKFGGDDFTATSLVVSQSAKEFDVTYTGLEKGPRVYRYGPYKNSEVQVEFIGLVTCVSMTASQQYLFTFVGPGTAAQQQWPVVASGNAICTSFSSNAAAGELYRGSMTLRIK